jgi:hypothetical protein
MKIIVGFSRPSKFKPFAWLIQKTYGVSYDHVYIRIHSEKYSRDVIYQASKTMVNFMGTDIFAADNVTIEQFEVNINDANYIKLMQFAMDKAGTPYGVRECFGMAWVKICSWFGKKISNPFKDSGHTYVCSELAAYILQQYAGDVLPTDIDDMTPLDVYNYLTKLKPLA